MLLWSIFGLSSTLGYDVGSERVPKFIINAAWQVEKQIQDIGLILLIW